MNSPSISALHPLSRVTWDIATAVSGVSYSILRRHVYRQTLSPLLKGFPEPAARGRRVLWVLADLLDWLNDQRTYRKKETLPAPVPAPAPTTTGRARAGRYTNEEKTTAEKMRTTVAELRARRNGGAK